ncbi:pyridoxamine 5'-phosphate oxidase family protein [Streptomyces sp. HNM0574]|uniref:pyridoxamine 5'-phosphate oxidase family protein n=1 Tax=Streptomyces sp. HNM0574 TaxID=2714954 RepID=UPI001F0F44E4|nr:pyridoxamine 5'-phosphate oxidase family protein [Streptomyces sp. HNM0574]
MDTRYSDPGAAPTRWDEARRRLAAAQVFWLSTVRPDGRPHVTPLLTVWQDDAPHFCTGPGERKAANLAANPHAVLTCGDSRLDAGEDLVVEGTAVRVTDEERLRRLAAVWAEKYGPDWHFDVRGGAFRHSGGEGEALVFALVPSVAFGFRRGEAAQTRWRFP